MKFHLLIAVLLCCSALTAAEGDAIKAILFCGGGWHDYKAQKDLLPAGINSASPTPIDWTVEFNHDNKFVEHIKANPNWAEGYDVAVFNCCYAGVKDNEFIDSLVNQITEAEIGVVMVHCALHTFLDVETDSWRNLLGAQSRSHHKQKEYTLERAHADHPITAGVAESFPSGPAGKGELYHILQHTAEVTLLYEGTGAVAKKSDEVVREPCAWIHTHKGVNKVFTISAGHFNETMEDPNYQRLVANGLLWTADRLPAPAE